MSRTMRKQWRHDMESDNVTIVKDARDSGCDHWGCTRHKWYDRKSKRARLKKALRRKPEEA